MVGEPIDGDRALRRSTRLTAVKTPCRQVASLEPERYRGIVDQRLIFTGDPETAPVLAAAT